MTDLCPWVLEVEGLVLRACQEPLAPKRQRGGLTWSAFS